MLERDEFDDPEGKNALASITEALDLRNRFQARGPLFTIVPLAGLAIVLAGVLIYSYPRASSKGGDAPVPTVHADATPYKAAPDDPGGMEIPWQDSTVFEALNKTPSDAPKEAPVENLLPEPEKPLPRAELFAGLKPEMTKEAAAAVAEEPTAMTPVETSEEPPAMPVAAVAAPEEKPVEAPKSIAEIIANAEPVETAAATPVAKPKTKIPDAVAAAKAAKVEPAAGAAGVGKAFVQLGSLKTREEATASWKKFQTTYPALSGVSLHIEEADLGAKGKFYRVQGGPVSAEKAKSLCAAVTAKKPGGCLVIKH